MEPMVNDIERIAEDLEVHVDVFPSVHELGDCVHSDDILIDSFKQLAGDRGETYGTICASLHWQALFEMWR